MRSESFYRQIFPRCVLVSETINPNFIVNYNEKLTNELKKYTGICTKDTLLKYLREPIEIAKKYNLKLYCGEFGCVPSVPRSDRLKWYSDVRKIFEENNIGWSNWDFKGAFSIYNSQTGLIDDNLVKILTAPIVK